MSRPKHLNIIDSHNLPSPSELIGEYPLSETHTTFITNTRDTIRNILNGKDSRKLIITGPCSIHDLESAKEYALKLKHLAEEVADTFFLVMRVYFEKPRTTLGWKGLLYDPDGNGSHDIEKGMQLTRKLLLTLTDYQVPAAAEFLDPISSYYFADLISWGCIGARTAESQTHREMASGLPMPVGFKNNTDGNPKIAINGAVTAATAHTYISFDMNAKASIIKTPGNPDSHIVLRGGQQGPNYDAKAVNATLAALAEVNLQKRIIIDCSHDNSGRQHDVQPMVFQSVIHQMIEGNPYIKGVILESHLKAGREDMQIRPGTYGISITDACMDWTTTEQLIRWAQQKFHHQKEAHTYETAKSAHCQHFS